MPVGQAEPDRAADTAASDAVPVLARFTIDGHECGIIPLDGEAASVPALAGTLSLGGQRYGVVCIHRPNGPDPVERLSPREFEIAALIACGCSDKEVARRLGISSHTVGAHIARCFAKLGLHKRAELAASIARRASPGR